MAPTDAVYPGQVLRVAPPPAATSLGQPPAAAAQPARCLAGHRCRGDAVLGRQDARPRDRCVQADHSVRAAAAGRVVYAGSGVKAYGPLVILKHENAITAYGHNGKLLVNEGDAVRQASRSPKWAPTRAAARRSSSKSARTARSSIR